MVWIRFYEIFFSDILHFFILYGKYNCLEDFLISDKKVQMQFLIKQNKPKFIDLCLRNFTLYLNNLDYAVSTFYFTSAWGPKVNLIMVLQILFDLDQLEDLYQ